MIFSLAVAAAQNTETLGEHLPLIVELFTIIAALVIASWRILTGVDARVTVKTVALQVSLDKIEAKIPETVRLLLGETIAKHEITERDNLEKALEDVRSKMENKDEKLLTELHNLAAQLKEIQARFIEYDERLHEVENIVEDVDACIRKRAKRPLRRRRVRG
jgi:flagellar motility protein MotE (MotC chaperone)